MFLNGVFGAVVGKFMAPEESWREQWIDAREDQPERAASGSLAVRRDVVDDISGAWVLFMIVGAACMVGMALTCRFVFHWEPPQWWFFYPAAWVGIFGLVLTGLRWLIARWVRPVAWWWDALLLGWTTLGFVGFLWD